MRMFQRKLHTMSVLHTLRHSTSRFSCLPLYRENLPAFAYMLAMTRATLLDELDAHNVVFSKFIESP